MATSPCTCIGCGWHVFDNDEKCPHGHVQHRTPAPHGQLAASEAARKAAVDWLESYKSALATLVARYERAVTDRLAAEAGRQRAESRAVALRSVMFSIACDGLAQYSSDAAGVYRECATKAIVADDAALATNDSAFMNSAEVARRRAEGALATLLAALPSCMQCSSPATKFSEHRWNPYCDEHYPRAPSRPDPSYPARWTDREQSQPIRDAVAVLAAAKAAKETP